MAPNHYHASLDLPNTTKRQVNQGKHLNLWGKTQFGHILMSRYLWDLCICKDLAQSLAKIGKALKPQHLKMTPKIHHQRTFAECCSHGFCLKFISLPTITIVFPWSFQCISNFAYCFQTFYVSMPFQCASTFAYYFV